MFNAFFIEKFSLLNKLSKVEFLNIIYNDFISALFLLRELVFQHNLPSLSWPLKQWVKQLVEQGLIDKSKVELFNVAYSKVELFNVAYKDFILTLEAVFQIRLSSLPFLSLIRQWIEQGFSHISKYISEPTLNLNSEFLKKENLLNSKNIFQSFESRFGFKVSETICTKRCFELMKVEPHLPSPYLTILSWAYQEQNCWSLNSMYPWDIKKLVSVDTYTYDIRELEKEMSNVLKALSSDLNQKQQRELNQSQFEFFV